MPAHDETLTHLPSGPPPRERMQVVLRALHPIPRKLILAPGPVVVGRAPPEGGLEFNDPTMSRAHARLTVRDHRLYVQDLDSHNGVWVTRERVQSATVPEGAVFRLGATHFLHRVEPVEQIDARMPLLVGDALSMRQLRADLALVAPSRGTVVLLGETGTGKSLAAKAIHEASRRTGPLIHVNCAAIPENLAEATLFGHRAGAFTDAKTANPGLIYASHRGTLLLDEVGLLSPTSQARLLLALELGQITPVGGTTPVSVDLRVIVATNEDLLAQVRNGRFRADLYARLADHVIHLPPLRARREDILPLFQAAWGPKVPPMAPNFVEHLLAWSWPFNVREVEKLASELLLRAENRAMLDVDLLGNRYLELVADAPMEPPRAAPRETGREAASEAPEPPMGLSGPPDRATLERLLASVQGNVSELARRVNRSTKQIYRWCNDHGVNPIEYRK